MQHLYTLNGIDTFHSWTRRDGVHVMRHDDWFSTLDGGRCSSCRACCMISRFDGDQTQPFYTGRPGLAQHRSAAVSTLETRFSARRGVWHLVPRRHRHVLMTCSGDIGLCHGARGTHEAVVLTVPGHSLALCTHIAAAVHCCCAQLNDICSTAVHTARYFRYQTVPIRNNDVAVVWLQGGVLHNPSRPGTTVLPSVGASLSAGSCCKNGLSMCVRV